MSTGSVAIISSRPARFHSLRGRSQYTSMPRLSGSWRYSASLTKWSEAPVNRAPAATTRWTARASEGRSGTRIAKWKRPVEPGGADMAKDLQRLLNRKDDSQYGLAFISAGEASREVVSSAGIDERAGGETLGRYLVSLGHRQVGFLKGPKDHLAAALRYDGFLDAFNPTFTVTGVISVSK